MFHEIRTLVTGISKKYLSRVSIIRYDYKIGEHSLRHNFLLISFVQLKLRQVKLQQRHTAKIYKSQWPVYRRDLFQGLGFRVRDD